MQVHLDIKEVIMLEVTESIEMKADECCHDFRPAHSTFPIAVLTPVRLTNGHASNLFIIFLAKIIDNTENFEKVANFLIEIRQLSNFLSNRNEIYCRIYCYFV